MTAYSTKTDTKLQLI